MRLADWAEKQGIAYMTAWRWFKNGKMPVKAVQTPMILIDPENGIDSLTQVKSTATTSFYARPYGKRSARNKV